MRLGKQTMMLPEFLAKHAPNYEIPKLLRQALLHGHCHDKAIMKMSHEQQLLQKMGLTVDLLNSGCCGMAGSFGFEREHYDVSVKCGERVLLPEVRSAPKETLIIADGFSCREQIEQMTDRKALHFAQVLRMASEHGPHGPTGNYPERAGKELAGQSAGKLRVGEWVLAGLGGVAVLALMRWVIRSRDHVE